MAECSPHVTEVSSSGQVDEQIKEVVCEEDSDQSFSHNRACGFLSGSYYALGTPLVPQDLAW